MKPIFQEDVKKHLSLLMAFLPWVGLTQSLNMFYAVTFFFVITLLLIYLDTRKPKNFPPGPKWYPILGSALQISKLREKHYMFWRVIAELDENSGGRGVIGLKLGKDKIVIAYSGDAIKEMYTNDDLIGRPTGPFYETRTWGQRQGIIFIDEDLWVEQRRFILRQLKDFGFARRRMVDISQTEAELMLNDIKQLIKYQGGEKAIVPMHNLLSVYVLNTLWSMIAGIRYDQNDPDFKKITDLFYQLFGNIDMVGCLFSHFPWLRFVAPNLSGYKQFLEVHKKVYEVFSKEIDKHQKRFCPENEPQDLIDSYLKVINSDENNANYTKKQLMAICLDMFLAGSETTTKSLAFGFLYMIRDPRVQAKVQAELDSVVGRERLPKWEDRINLPYCEAVVHESLRIFVGNAFGIPHRALRDTRLAGYNIPKDTMVIGCFSGMLLSETFFKSPYKFKPERFLKDNKLVVPDTFAPFGAGKRRCMGELMARQNLFLFITTLLQNFKFLVPEGHLLPDDEPIEGATPSVRPYQAVIVPR